MRIVLDGRYIQDHFPGIARYTFNLAFALGELGLEDDLVVLVDPHAPNHRYDLDLLRRTRGLRLHEVVASPFSPKGFACLVRNLIRLRPDVYHTPYFFRLPILPCASAVTIFDLIAEHRLPEASDGARSWILRQIFHLANAAAVRSSTRIIVPSTSTFHDVLQRHSASRGKLITIPLAVDPTFRPSTMKEVQFIRARYRLPDRFILFLGINKPHKNLEALVRVLADPRLGDVSLVAAGPVDRRYPNARDLARAFGVDDRVRPLGDITAGDLSGLYAAAEALVCPSLDEGFGLTPLEAMACGTPVICSNRGSLPEVVGDAAMQFDPLEPAQLIRAISQLWGNRSLAERMRSAGLRRAREHSWHDNAKATLEVYRQAAGQR